MNLPFSPPNLDPPRAFHPLWLLVPFILIGTGLILTAYVKETRMPYYHDPMTVGYWVQYAIQYAYHAMIASTLLLAGAAWLAWKHCRERHQGAWRVGAWLAGGTHAMAWLIVVVF